ncbi:MAG: TetR family transcriptional regulator C-terminal domain-containing protein [Candidatus Rokubacteria bacterium]|nr:TetR family transcriptional regulator C-terminal domain-containing protein [Candidatus Rokubacteria bacterium]
MTTPAASQTGGNGRARHGGPTREAILEAASRLIQINGYHSTSLDDVLRESGIGKGNFYYHFKSKEGLGYAILDQIVASFLDRTVAPCFSDPGGRPLAQIRCFLDRVLEAQRARNCVGGCPLGNLASELSDVHEGFRTRLARVFSAWRERLTTALGEAQARGDVGGECRPPAVAQFLVASLEGAILMTKVTKNIAVMEECVAEMKRYLSLYERGAT